MAEVRRNLFRTIGDDPDFKLLPPEAQSGIRRDWVEQQMTGSGRPYDQKLYEQLIREASYDLPQTEEKQSKFWFGGEMFPAAEEYAPRMLKFVDRLGRVFSAPQQYLQSAFRRPPDQPLAERVITPFAETTEGLIKDITGEERELRYPYTMYTDPLLLGGIGKFGTRFLKKGIRSIEELAKRVRAPGAKVPSPMTGEAAEAFNRAKLVEEAARREALKATVKEAVPPQRTIGQPSWPTLRKEWTGVRVLPEEIKIIKHIKPKLAPHYSPDEIVKIRDFVLQHPEDIITKSLLSKKGLSPEVTREIGKRVLFERPEILKGMPTLREAERGVKGVKLSPPKVRAPEPSTPEALNTLEGLASELRKMGD